MEEVSDRKKGISPLGGGIVLAVLTVLILGGAAYLAESQGTQSPQVYENIEATEAKDLIASEDPVVLDVRTPDEFENGHIPGAILIPVDELKGSTLLEFPHDKGVLCYCRSGHRSSWAAEYLSRQDYAKVYNLSGGILAWKEHSYEVVRARENKPECPCVVLDE